MEVKEENNTTENIEIKQENNVEKINNNEVENEELKNINIEKTNTDIQELNTDKIETNKNQEDSRTFKPLDEQNYKNKNKSDVLTIFAILCFIFVLLSLIIFGTFSFINLTSTKIAKGVYIKGIDVSGLTKEDATKKISSYVSSSIPEEIKLKHNDFETSLSTSQLAIYFNTEEAVNMAYNIGKTGNIFQKNIEILETLFSKVNIDPGFSIDEEQLKKDLQDTSTKLPDKVIESSCYIDDNRLIITKGQAGKSIKVKDSANYITKEINNLNVQNNTLELITEDAYPNEINLDAIYNEVHKDPVNAYYSQNPYVVHPSENGMDFAISLDDAKNLLQEEKDEYVIPLKVLYPSVTTNMIGTEAFPDLLSEFSTKYSASNKNRTTNLILASKKINGTVLMPGETFSYNKVVGERTIAAGYKEAPIYVSGRVEDGIGGGICQITTTLYNAVLYANLDIVERSNHQFVPSYAGPSRDATVVYGAIDFKFKNNRDYPIKITCSVSGGIANFKIWGLKSDNDYEVQITSRTTGKTANAIYSEAYKTLKKNGAVVSTTLLSKDTYKRH